MPNATDAERLSSRSEAAFLGFLAALYRSGLGQVDDNGDVLHESFETALQVLREDPATEPLFKRFHMGGFSRRIDALDQALIRAEQYGWVQFPNPTYERLKIAMSPQDAEALLEDLGALRTTIENAAEAFRRHFLEHSW